MERFAECGDYDGLGLAELVGNGAVHPRELVEAATARIERACPSECRAPRRRCSASARSWRKPAPGSGARALI
jgi:hypothetical protein